MPEPASRQGEEKTYLDLLARYGRIAPAIARLYTPAGEDPSDLEQEIRLQWWRSLAGFSGRSKASTWMYQVALHTALTFLRRHHRRLRPNSLREETQVRDSAPRPGGTVDRRRTALHAALSRLDPAERALAYLWLEECSYEEIAAVSGISANAVGVRLHRIRGRLKTMLATVEEKQ